MKHPYDSLDDFEIIFRYVQPEIESLDQLGTNLFAWDLRVVGIWLQEDLQEVALINRVLAG
jgi:hypothetical protein